MTKKKSTSKATQRRYWQNWLLTGVLFITLAMMAGLITQTIGRHWRLASLARPAIYHPEATHAVTPAHPPVDRGGGQFLDLDYDEDWFDDDWYDNDWYDDDWYRRGERPVLDAAHVRHAQFVNLRQAELMLAALSFIAGTVIAYWLLSDFSRLTLEQTISGKRVWYLLLVAAAVTALLYWLCLAMIF